MPKPILNVALKVAVVKSAQRQRDIARRARIPEARFSHIVRGRLDPSDKERRAIAKALGRSQDELFPETSVTAS